MLKKEEWMLSTVFGWVLYVSVLYIINQFKPDEISHFYQLDQSISIFGLFWWYLSFYLIST